MLPGPVRYMVDVICKSKSFNRWASALEKRSQRHVLVESRDVYISWVRLVRATETRLRNDVAYRGVLYNTGVVRRRLEQSNVVHERRRGGDTAAQQS